MEMLVVLGLTSLLMGLLIKLYLWQNQIQTKIDEMIFLDHNGVLAMTILENNIKGANKIDLTQIQNNQIRLDNTMFYVIKQKGLYIKEKNKNPNGIEIISGVTYLHVIRINNHQLQLSIQIAAPKGMTEVFTEKLDLIQSI